MHDDYDVSWGDVAAAFVAFVSIGVSLLAVIAAALGVL